MILLSGRPPDFIAFVITILMMLLMAAGVKKSLVFNNVLNAINLAVWVFVMAAGMFYVDSENWSEHKGFLPYGWSGVSIGQSRASAVKLQEETPKCPEATIECERRNAPLMLSIP
jgi:amino acid transporter